jgi:hypothetical protein
MSKPSIRPRLSNRSTSALLGVLGALVVLGSSPVAWRDQRVHGQPLALPEVLSNPGLWSLLLAGAIAVWLVQAVQFSSIGTMLAFRLSRLQQRLARVRGQLLVNATIFSLSAMVATGDTILPPELTTHDAALRWLQAAAAGALFFRRGAPFAGFAFLLLFAIGIVEYGPLPMVGHLMFVGLGLFFVLPIWPIERRVAVLRVTTALSLMWLAVDKWIEPSWVARLAHDHPVVTLGLSGEGLVLAAGVVQCALGFGLLWRGLYATVSAVALMLFILAAVVESGFADLAGQLALLGVLLFLALDRVPTRMYGRSHNAGSVALSFLLSAVAALLIHFALVYAQNF